MWDVVLRDMWWEITYYKKKKVIHRGTSNYSKIVYAICFKDSQYSILEKNKK